MNNHTTPDNFFNKACSFEASLIVVAVVFGWIADINPFANLYFSETAVAYGVLGTMPLLLLLLGLEQINGDALVKIKHLLLDTLGPSLHRYHWTDLFMLAAIAGLSQPA